MIPSAIRPGVRRTGVGGVFGSIRTLRPPDAAVRMRMAAMVGMLTGDRSDWSDWSIRTGRWSTDQPGVWFGLSSAALLAFGCLALGLDPVAVVAGAAPVAERVAAALAERDHVVVLSGVDRAAVVTQVAGWPAGEDGGPFTPGLARAAASPGHRCFLLRFAVLPGQMPVASWNRSEQ